MNELPMPFLDSTITRLSSRHHLGYTRLQLCIDGKITNYSLLQYEERWASFWKPSQNPIKMNLGLGHQKKPHPKFLVRATTTFEPKTCLVLSEDGGKENNASPCIAESMSSKVHVGSSGADSEEIDAKEKLRRVRISKANKGNIPWNKGKKHSPETVQRIRERTKLAMQNPKVKMKFTSLGHTQSQETREKIGYGVRMGWKRRRQKQVIQETCLFDWQNIIADAARKGFHDGEELQWDSYEILKEQLQQEWLDSIEYRKTMVRPKSSRRAPKPLEQRRKIAEAIAAKWADPEYRVRVRTGWAIYHKTPEAKRKVKRKPSCEGQSRKTPKKKVSDAEESIAYELKVRLLQPKLKKKYAPNYEDPLASSKLEMLKSIRAQRVTKKNETLEQARILIAEAKKAADILEIVAMRSPTAEASLTESRKLIAEAAQTIERIENGDIGSHHDAPSGHDHNKVKKNGNALAKVPSEEYSNGVNGIAFLQSGEGENLGFDLYKLRMLKKLDMNNHLPEKLGRYEFPKVDSSNPTIAWFGSHHNQIWRDSALTNLNPTSKDNTFWKHIKEFEHGDAKQKSEHHHDLHEPNGISELNGIYEPNGAKMQPHESPPPKTVTKKWVRGRLVEVVGGE